MSCEISSDSATEVGKSALEYAHARRNIITAFMDAQANHILASMTFAGRQDIKKIDLNKVRPSTKVKDRRFSENIYSKEAQMEEFDRR